MKLISFAVASYNSASYMRKCIKSLLLGKDEVEIIIVDDGSKDETGKIADDYQAHYPDIVKVVHQENGGHGEGLNSSMKVATGLYFKVVDSDDWVNYEALKNLLDFIRADKDLPDLFITDYDYYCGYEKVVRQMRYKQCFPVGKTFGWDEVGRMDINQYMTIHSIMYKTEVWRKSHGVLPKHTFYEDNLFVTCGIGFVKTMRYLPGPFYCYLVGRPGQSVSSEVSVRRAGDFIKVAYEAFDKWDIYAFKKTEHGLYKVLIHQLAMIITPAFQNGRISKDPQVRKALKEFVQHAKKSNPRQYRRIVHMTGVGWLSLGGPLGYLNCRFMHWCLSLVKYNA